MLLCDHEQYRHDPANLFVKYDPWICRLTKIEWPEFGHPDLGYLSFPQQQTECQHSTLMLI
jgi:hypothetical protein